MPSRVWGSPRVQLLLLLIAGSAVAGLITASGRVAGEGLFRAYLGGRFPWLSVCFWATFFIHLITLKGARRKNLVVLAGLSELPNALPTRPSWALPIGLGLAVTAVLYRGALAYRAPPGQRLEHLRASFDALVPPWFCLISTQPLAWGASVTPLVRDPEIQAIGGVLGPWPPLMVGRLFADSALLRGTCTLVYSMMPLGLAVVHAFSFRADPRKRPSLLLAFLLIPFLGYPLYFALPMVGPREAWACLAPHLAFPPPSLPHFTSTLLAPSVAAPRNCMPSLHTAWTFAALLEARRVSRGLAAFAAAWFICTELATLGMGEHWLIDLVVAIPFTFAVHALADGKLGKRESWPALAAMVGMVLGWIVLLAKCTAALQARPWAVAAAMLLTLVTAVALAPRLLGARTPSDDGSLVPDPNVTSAP